MPDTSIKTPVLLAEHSVSTFIPSATAPGAGLAVNVIYPEKTRYAAGAPIAVVVPGGDTGSGLTFSAHISQEGMAEVRFALPGDGTKGLQSGGIFDYRGVESQKALKDILLFAGGKTVDTQGRHIGEVVPVKVSTDEIGVIGWSNGGNLAIITLAKFAKELSFINWLTFYESPVGAMMYPANLGSQHDLVINPHYREGSSATGECLVDYRKLAYSKDGNRDADQHKKRGEPILPGIIYFDENWNQRWDEATEFAFSYALDVGLEKQIYPPDVAAALNRRQVFWTWKEDYGPMGKPRDEKGNIIHNPEEDKLSTGQQKRKDRELNLEHKMWVGHIAAQLKAKPDINTKISFGAVMRRKPAWPDDIATVAESEAYYKERDGSLYIDQLCAGFPNLLVDVFGSVVDHLQRQNDHPSIALLYNAFLSNHAHWLRLNPDPTYVGWAATMNPINFVSNKVNAPIDASSITSQLEPEGLVPDYLYIDAAAAELADRTHRKKYDDPLAEVLVKYQYGGGPPPKLVEEK
ncbi:MAG TPA: hypothetical protein V6C81_24635 [Planktothrix sp.]|jgi:hypothetical protein